MSDPSPLADDERLAPLLDQYVSALQTGDDGQRRALLADHPEIAAWTEGLDLLEALAAPTRETLSRPSQPSAPTHADPRRFGAYELLSEAGRGGMGVVYRARQVELNRVVALKMILASRLASPDDVRRFQHEARAAASIRHPHVVGIHEVGQVDGQHYFTMDFVEGPSLAKLLEQGPLPPRTAARYIAAVARAIDFLHSQGVVHRDLKPSNILIDQRDEPQVTDFGLAKLFGDDPSNTRTGLIMGTPSYMAPEQARGDVRSISPRTDVYGLGAVLYELITGQPPFRDETPIGTVMQVLEREPPPPRSVQKQVPRDLDRICLRALEKSPERRYSSAAAMADDLERLLRDEPITIPADDWWQKLRRWSRRQPALAAHAGGIVAVIAIITANYLWRHPDTRLYLEILSALIAWLIASAGLQQLLVQPATETAARWSWAAVDVAALTVILYLTGPPLGPLVGGYAVLIVASGLWFDVALARLTGALAVGAYLALSSAVSDETQPIHFRLTYAAGLAVVTVVIQFLVQRIAVLTRFAGRR